MRGQGDFHGPSFPCFSRCGLSWKNNPCLVVLGPHMSTSFLEKTGISSDQAKDKQLKKKKLEGLFKNLERCLDKTQVFHRKKEISKL
jgi:hypothetical protein